MPRLICLTALACLFLAPASVPVWAQPPAVPSTKVPRWDARGVGPPAAYLRLQPPRAKSEKE